MRGIRKAKTPNPDLDQFSEYAVDRAIEIFSFSNYVKSWVRSQYHAFGQVPDDDPKFRKLCRAYASKLMYQ